MIFDSFLMSRQWKRVGKWTKEGFPLYFYLKICISPILRIKKFTLAVFVVNWFFFASFSRTTQNHWLTKKKYNSIQDFSDGFRCCNMRNTHFFPNFYSVYLPFYNAYYRYKHTHTHTQDPKFYPFCLFDCLFDLIVCFI